MRSQGEGMSDAQRCILPGKTSPTVVLPSETELPQAISDNTPVGTN